MYNTVQEFPFHIPIKTTQTMPKNKISFYINIELKHSIMVIIWHEKNFLVIAISLKYRSKAKIPKRFDFPNKLLKRKVTVYNLTF